MDIRAAEISTILKDQIENFGADAEVTEVGKVLSVGDGIARVYGVQKLPIYQYHPLTQSQFPPLYSLDLGEELAHHFLQNLTFLYLVHKI